MKKYYVICIDLSDKYYFLGQSILCNIYFDLIEKIIFYVKNIYFHCMYGSTDWIEPSYDLVAGETYSIIKWSWI